MSISTFLFYLILFFALDSPDPHLHLSHFITFLVLIAYVFYKVTFKTGSENEKNHSKKHLQPRF